MSAEGDIALCHQEAYSRLKLWIDQLITAAQWQQRAIKPTTKRFTDITARFHAADARLLDDDERQLLWVGVACERAMKWAATRSDEPARYVGWNAYDLGKVAWRHFDGSSEWLLTSERWGELARFVDVLMTVAVRADPSLGHP